MTIIAWFLDKFGLAGVLVAGLLVFYEGLPGINYVTPVLRIVPGIGEAVDDLAQGRVGRAYQRGRDEERAAAEEQRRLWEDRKRVEIAGIEAGYLDDRRTAKDALAALERELSDAKASDDTHGCPDAIPASLSKRLNAVGRSAAAASAP